MKLVCRADVKHASNDRMSAPEEKKKQKKRPAGSIKDATKPKKDRPAKGGEVKEKKKPKPLTVSRVATQQVNEIFKDPFAHELNLNADELKLVKERLKLKLSARLMAFEESIQKKCREKL